MLLTSAVFAIALPPVPGGMIALLNVLFNQYGIPVEMLCIAIATNFIFDVLQTPPHIMGKVAQNIVLNSKLKNKE